MSARASAPLDLPLKPRPARPVGRKRRPRKLGRPKSKAHFSKARYLRSHQPKRLRRNEVLNLIQADAFAARIGQPLITFTTIRWAFTKMGEANINRRYSDLLNGARIWCARRGIPWTAIGVHENPPSKEPSFNSHLLSNIPTSLHGAFTSWLMKTLGGCSGAVHIRPRMCPGWDADETLSYMLKGTDKPTAMRFHLIRKQGWKFNQGIVPFRRCTTTRNIGAPARKKFSEEYGDWWATRAAPLEAAA